YNCIRARNVTGVKTCALPISDVAAASAGVILAGNDPRSVLSVLHLSTAAYRTMQQNLWWASGYNLIAVPLAAGVLAPIGFVMPGSGGRRGWSGVRSVASATSD